jgi:hypothetical protein
MRGTRIAMVDPAWSVSAMAMTGAVILCDQVYQTQGGKYVIAGTFTTIEVRVADLAKVEHVVSGFHLYLRARPERTGQLVLDVRLRDEQRAPWEAPILALRCEVPVDERTIRLVELGLPLPPFTLRVAATDEPPAGAVLQLRYAVELLHDGELIGTAPLDVRFVRAVRTSD